MKFASVQEEQTIIESLRTVTTLRPNEFLCEDGYRRCKTCGERTETLVPGIYFKPMLIRADCACIRSRQDEEAKRQLQEKIEQRRNTAFRDNKRWKSYTFAKDDHANPLLTKRVQMFVSDTAAYLQTAVERRGDLRCPGLLLYGDTGGGKTYMAAAACNALCEHQITPFMATTEEIIGEMMPPHDKTGYLTYLCRYPVWVLDDYGEEGRSEYVQRLIFQLFNTALTHNIVLLITSNLTGKDFSSPQDKQAKRIYDRIFESCDTLEVVAQNRRMEGAVAVHRMNAKRLMGE